MASPAQIAANQSNATLSTGPQTDEGKQASSQNNFRHGLASNRVIIEGECLEEYNALRDAFIAEHQPATPTETALVNGMVQHYWFSQRAIALQTTCFTGSDVDTRKLSLYLRYQTTHDRAFHKCLNDLLKLRAQKVREQIGFESQRLKQALNEAKIRAQNAKTAATEIDTDIRSTVEAPLPGHMRIPFDAMKTVFASAVRELNQHA